MSTDPHVPSDDAAILRAHARRFANAQRSFDRACRVCREHPNRWNIQAVTQAMLGLSDEYLAGLERKAGREPGSYPRLNEEIYPPQIRPPAVEAWEDGPCGVGMSDRCVPFSDCQDERGIHHTPDSPIPRVCPSEDRHRLVPRHMPPVDPTIAAEDPA